MPKLKKHSGTKDRVRVTKNGKGKVRAGHPNTSHFMQKKRGSRKRTLSGLDTLGTTNSKTIKLKLGV